MNSGKGNQTEINTIFISQHQELQHFLPSTQQLQVGRGELAVGQPDPSPLSHLPSQMEKKKEGTSSKNPLK